MISSHGTADDECRLPEIEQRLGRFLSRREHPRQHEDDGQLRELRRLANANAPDGEPPLNTRRGPGAGPEQQRDDEEEDAEDVEVYRHPLDEAHRRAKDHVPGTKRQHEPPELTLPRADDVRHGKVSLPRGIHDGDAVRG